MTRKQVETSREVRLWITGIIGPIIIGGASIISSNPELGKALWVKGKEQITTLKQKISKKLE